MVASTGRRVDHSVVPMGVRYVLRGSVSTSSGSLGIGESRFAPVAVEPGKRLVLALEQDAHVDQLHACGGNARCTTCRVEFISGEPTKWTKAEKTRLEERGLTGIRLSCQILCDQDMTVRAISRLEGSGRPDPGATPDAAIAPPPQWV